MIRKQLQELLDDYKSQQLKWQETILLDSRTVISSLESILAENPPELIERLAVDPWPDIASGGPDCVMEVKR